MIDFVKIRIHNLDWDSFLNNPLLDFHQLVNIATGELTGNLFAEYQGLKFTKYVSNVMIIEGSLHKYKNFGKHNYDDFNLLQVIEVINDIITKFHLDPRNCTIVNLEVGANIIPVNPTKELLRYLYMHQKREFRWADIKDGYLKRICYEEYQLKAYDKAKHYRLKEELFRFEVRLLRGRILKKNGVYTLEDLMNPKCFINLCKLILDKWSEVLVWDPAVMKYLMTDDQRQRYQKWENPNYWSSLTQEKYRNAYSKEYKKYKDDQARFLDNLHGQILTALVYKLYSLYNPSNSQVQIRTLTKESKSTTENDPLDDW